MPSKEDDPHSISDPSEKIGNESFNVVGVNVLNQKGVDVPQIIQMLVYNASVEFTAYYYFTNLLMHCTGAEGESIKEVIEDARLEDLSF